MEKSTSKPSVLLHRPSSFDVLHHDSMPVMPLPDLEDVDISKLPWWSSKRFQLAALNFFGFGCLYAQRVNLSIAIVCMVSHNDNSSDTNVSSKSFEESNCPSLSYRDQEAEFDWNKSLQGLILGAFFWGYLTLQILGGRLSERLGAKKVVAYAMFPVAILNILTPVTARVSPYLLLVLRVFVGVGQSVMYPSAQALWANWAPPQERTKLVGFSYAGGQFGNALMFPIGGYLCAKAGWDSVFYFIGSVGFFWCVLWVIFAHDTPNEHPSISDLEKHYINASLGRSDDDVKVSKKPPVPWKAIFTSRPFWAILVAHICGNYGAYMLLTKIPSYMKEVLKFDIKSNGLYSMMPYLSFWLVIVVGGIVADRIILRETISVKNTRKMLAFLGFVLPGVSLIGLGYMDCEQAQGAVILLCMSVGLCGLQFCSFFVNHSDIAPMYAGTMFGITNTMATIPGILSPYVVSAMTTNGTREEWQDTFYLASGIYFFGALFYCFLAEGTIQPWAKMEEPGDDDVKTDNGGKDTTFILKEIDDKNNSVVDEEKNDEEYDNDKNEKGQDLLASVKLIAIGEDSTIK